MGHSHAGKTSHSRRQADLCSPARPPVIYLYQSLALAPYFNWVESAPARELFDFQNPESVAAIKFLEA